MSRLKYQTGALTKCDCLNSAQPCGPVHLVDITTFYPAQTGGVRTYLRAKSCWLKKHTGVQHSVVAPVIAKDRDPGVIGIPSFPIPYGNGFRWPVLSALATRCLLRLAPQLIKAVEELGAPYHLLLVGRGKVRQVSSFVTCLPYEAEPRALAGLIAACDLFVHPGQHETFGLVVLEALACCVANACAADTLSLASGRCSTAGKFASCAEAD